MGRRSFISMTAINRMISASNSRRREQERIDLINSQSGTKKELAPTYSITNIDFNTETRITKIEFLQTQQYRTIDKYVTQNYVKYPIYSNWKTRTKIIKKSIKLTNREIEDLEHNDDELIRQFAKEIVLGLNDEELYPSWFIHYAFLQEYKEKVEELNSNFSKFSSELTKSINNYKKKIKNNNEYISNVKITLTKIEKKFNKITTKIDNIETAKKSAVKYIFSFGLYAYAVSNRRKNKLIIKQTELQKAIDEINIDINNKLADNETCQNGINALQEKIKLKENEVKSLTSKAYQELKKNQNTVVPLQTTVSTDNSFFDLSSIGGIEYSKIIGCYIIRNKVKDKYYVGQSKDVLKRLRQHFKGTVPNNVIFAEDYYSEISENRDNLFEVKIIPCETKDELDRTEKRLIEEYDAFNNGYNGTNGNS